MKKFITILLLLITLTANSQIKFGSNLEFGYEDRITTINEISPIYYPTDNFVSVPSIMRYDTISHSARYKNNMFAKIDIECNYKNFSIYTNQKTYFTPINIVRYNPLLIEFIIGANYKYKNIQISYEHLCIHSIDNITLNGGYNRVSAKLKLF